MVWFGVAGSSALLLGMAAYGVYAYRRAGVVEEARLAATMDASFEPISRESWEATEEGEERGLVGGQGSAGQA